MKSVRVQVVLDDKERAAFRRQARLAGKSLSAWLREAGHEQLRAGAARRRFESPEALRDFFRRCDEAAGAGQEPDWAEHARVIGDSRRQGLPDP